MLKPLHEEILAALNRDQRVEFSQYGKHIEVVSQTTHLGTRWAQMMMVTHTQMFRFPEKIDLMLGEAVRRTSDLLSLKINGELK